jgi:indole-3-glycerol phosphate synthase
MNNFLEKIMRQKEQEVALLGRDQRLNDFLINGEKIKAEELFTKAMRKEGLSIIAEVKRRSPSRGVISNISSPAEQAQKYFIGGANAISVLTDEGFFGGSIEDLTKVKEVAEKPRMPVLRKDFIIDPLQIAESVLIGADAILLIVAVLGERITKMLALAENFGIEVLTEVRTKDEINLALNSGTKIIGINNRDLTTFKVDINKSLELVKFIPDDIIKIAESGITSPAIAQNFYQQGFNGVLIGESLMRAKDPALFIRECRGER